MNTMPIKKPMETQHNTPLDLWDFSIIASHGVWQPVPHINLIYEFLHYAMNGQLENFACALSPRLGKSMGVSELFPAYILGERPYAKIIHVSYSDSLARSFGGKAKNTLDEFGHLFQSNPTLSEDTKAKNWFKVKKHGGEYFCAGSGGSVLGRGGNWIIVDDPTKNIEEARSPRHQEKILDLFDTTISTRKEKDPHTGQNAVTIVIHQRLDRKDLIGLILEEREWIPAEEALPRLRNGEKLGHTWVYLRLPELAEDNDILGRQAGEALWPEKRSRKELLQIKNDIGSYKFRCIHQQDPPKREGNIFKPEWFYDSRREVHPHLLTTDEQLAPRPELNFIRYWDFGASGTMGDATSGLKTTYYNNDMVLDDLVHGPFSASQTLHQFESTTIRDGERVRSVIEQEPGSGTKLLIEKFRLLPNLAGFRFFNDKVNVNKLDRCFDLENLTETGRLKFNQSRLPMNKIRLIIDELIAFTGKDGGVDNIVDTLSGSARFWLIPRVKLKRRKRRS